MKSLRHLLLILLLSVPALAAPVFQSGFETGDFFDWNPPVNPNNDPNIYVINNPNSVIHTGGWAMAIGNLATPGDPSTFGQLTVDIATQIGETYQVSFWLLHDDLGLSADNRFLADFGGSTLDNLDDIRVLADGYSLYSFNHIATTATTTLAFSFYDNNGFFYLDDVLVQSNAVPEIDASSAAIPVSLCIVMLLAFSDRRKRAPSLV